MTAQARTPLKMRSWLFAPGDSEKKMAKATEGAADIVIYDLEDAVAEANKPAARELVRSLLESQRRLGPPAEPHETPAFAGDHAEAVDPCERLWVRINPLDGPHTRLDLAAIMPARPGGIMLPKSRGRDDVEELDRLLTAQELAHGIVASSTPVIALVTETAAAMFTTGDYAGAPRLVAMTWGAEDLADSIGAMSNRGPDGEFSFTYELARSLCLLGAAAAGVTAIETIQADFRDLDGLRERAERVRREGYRGMLAIHPAQVEVINEAFSPSTEELTEAREIVALFEANPDAGTIGWKGGMLDRPHLSRARQVLAQAHEG